MATSVANIDALEPQAPMDPDQESPRAPDEAERRWQKALPAPASPFRRVCPTRRLLALLAVFCGSLVLAAGILGVKGVQLGKGLQEAQEGLAMLNKTLMLGISSLTQKRNSTEGKLARSEQALKQESGQLEKVKERAEEQLDAIGRDARTLLCELTEMKSNGSKSGCCPRGWLTFRSSCYWITESAEQWEEARRDCENRKSYLLIINSPDEKAFVNQHRRSEFTWIGLTDVSGDWKWVDGSSYTLDPKDWSESQPDHWYGHGLGGGEDCVHLMGDGLWNDNHCSRAFPWICEMELGL